MRARRPCVLPLLLIVIASFAASCGGRGKDSPQPPPQAVVQEQPPPPPEQAPPSQAQPDLDGAPPPGPQTDVPSDGADRMIQVPIDQVTYRHDDQGAKIGVRITTCPSSARDYGFAPSGGVSAATVADKVYTTGNMDSGCAANVYHRDDDQSCDFLVYDRPAKAVVSTALGPFDNPREASCTTLVVNGVSVTKLKFTRDGSTTPVEIAMAAEADCSYLADRIGRAASPPQLDAKRSDIVQAKDTDRVVYRIRLFPTAPCAE